MIYTEDIKNQLDNILKAFEEYIDGQDYFDIVYSKKVGYVWIVIDPPGGAGAEQLDTPEAMLDVLFNDIVNDVVSPRESNSRAHETHALMQSEEAEVRHRITAILGKIKDGREECFDYLDRYINNYQERYREDDE